MTYYNYTSFYLFFLFVIYLFLEIEPFTPAERYSHSSVLVSNKLYFFGGAVRNLCSNEVLQLDVSQPFSIATPPWNDLTANEGMPIKSCFGTVSLIETNNEQSIYLFGGMTKDLTTNLDSPKSLVYKLNLKSGQWEIPIIKGNAPERRRNINAVNDNSGKVYIFGGGTDSEIGSPILKYFNDTVIFNAVELSWSIGSFLPNAPTQRASYSATLLSNGVIVYIGGYGFVGNTNQAVDAVDISQINLFDTKTLTWSPKTAKSIGQIENRSSHTAVLAPNDKNKIIIYGGCKSITSNFFAKVTPDLAVLNTETFEWTIPLVSSNTGFVPSLVFHTANLVGNYMIVAFGNITQPNVPTVSTNANIYIMDIRNYTWINTFEPENIAKPTPTTNDPSITSKPSEKPTNTSGNKSDVIIGTISGIVGTAVLMLIGIFGYKWYQRHQREKRDGIMRIHGNSGNIAYN